MGSRVEEGLDGSSVADRVDMRLTNYGLDLDMSDDEELGSTCNPRDASSHSLIERTVEAAVLTTLLRRHGTAHLPAAVADLDRRQAASLDAREYDRFLAHLVDGDSEAALLWLKPWRHSSGRLDDAVAGLLTSAAQRLGKAWEDDALSFVDVSMGLVTLQRVLHAFTPPPSAMALPERRMLLAPVPGESHCFGVRMLAVQFAQSGWNCHCEAAMPEEALIRLVGERSFDVVGLSVYDGQDKGLVELVGRLRKASRQPGVRVLLGGALFANQPDVALALGADLPALPFVELCKTLDRLIPPPG